MASSLAVTSFVVVIVTLIIAILAMRIYKKTKGGSKAYYYWALGSALSCVGASITFVLSLFFDINQMNIQGEDALASTISLSLYLVAYWYLALGAIFITGQLELKKYNLEKALKLTRYIFLGIIIWSLSIISLIIVIDRALPVRMFYVPFLGLVWFLIIYNIIPVFNMMKGAAKESWFFISVGAFFGFLSNVGEILANVVLEELLFLKPLCYAFMGLFVSLGFFKLGRDLEAF